MRRTFLSLLAAAAALSVFGAAPAKAAYPDRPITLIVPWGAGGGTDAAARIIAAGLQKEMGQPVNVVNRTGGSGVVGHAAIATAPPDGYTLGMATVEIGMMHWQGLTELTSKDYTPLALMNYDAAAMFVRADSPHKSVGDVVGAIKASPGKLKSSGTGQGGIWHLALAGLLVDRGVDPAASPWVPSQGAAPSLQDLVAGGVDVVACSLPEARSLIDAGRVKGLAVMAAERNAALPDIPTLKESAGSDWQMGTWRGIVGPKGMPAEAGAKLIPVLEKVFNSAEYKEFMGQRGFGMRYLAGAEYATFMEDSDKRLGEVMKAAKLAK